MRIIIWMQKRLFVFTDANFWALLQQLIISFVWHSKYYPLVFQTRILTVGVIVAPEGKLKLEHGIALRNDLMMPLNYSVHILANFKQNFKW